MGMPCCAVRDFKVLAAAESGRNVSDDKKASKEDLEASREIGAEDEGPVVNEYPGLLRLTRRSQARRKTFFWR